MGCEWSSHLAVSYSVEESFAPRVANVVLESTLLNLVLDIRIESFSVNATGVGGLLVGELEHVTINNHVATIFENFKEGLFILKVSFFMELAESKEIFAVDSVVSLSIEGQGSHINAGFSSLDAATKTRLILVDRLQDNLGVRVLPETTEVALLIAAGNPILFNQY